MTLITCGNLVIALKNRQPVGVADGVSLHYPNILLARKMLIRETAISLEQYRLKRFIDSIQCLGVGHDGHSQLLWDFEALEMIEAELELRENGLWLYEVKVLVVPPGDLDARLRSVMESAQVS